MATKSVAVRSAGAGKILIEFDSVPPPADYSDLSTALFVIRAEPTRLLIDDAGQASAVLTHVAQFSKDRGYHLVLDEKLRELQTLTAEEKTAARAIRSGVLGLPRQFLTSLRLHR